MFLALFYAVLWERDMEGGKGRTSKYCMPPPVRWRFKHMLFHRALDLWPFDPKLWYVHLCPITHRWRKFGENVSNILQDIVLTMFRDGRTHGRTGQKQYASGQTTLGGGIKRGKGEKRGLNEGGSLNTYCEIPRCEIPRTNGTNYRPSVGQYWTGCPMEIGMLRYRRWRHAGGLVMSQRSDALIGALTSPHYSQETWLHCRRLHWSADSQSRPRPANLTSPRWWDHMGTYADVGFVTGGDHR